jgi:hypothetical protein
MRQGLDATFTDAGDVARSRRRASLRGVANAVIVARASAGRIGVARVMSWNFRACMP